MTVGAKNLLIKMANAIDSGHENYFDIDFYCGFPTPAITELEDTGMITDLKNITGAVKLTVAGYNAAKK